MCTWPENTCMICDMPWKNNRVVYEGCPCAWKETTMGAALALPVGNVLIRVSKTGEVSGTQLDEKRRLFAFQTGYEVQNGTMAADVASKTLFFAAGNALICLSLETGNVVWEFEMPGKASSPMLFEQAQGQSMLPLLGAGDDQGNFVALNRENGERLWETQIGFPVSDVACHIGQRLILCCTKLIVCLDAANGDTIWFVNATATRGALHGDTYIAGGKGYSMIDGSRVF